MRTTLTSGLFLFAFLLLTGCSSEATRTQVKGSVTYEGKPVAVGVVYINPDIQKNNIGVQGYAEIVGGQFDTSSPNGKGASAGHVVIRVEAFDGKSDPERPKGGMLFAYETKKELGTGETTLDLSIKASEVRKDGGSSGTHVGP